MDIPKLVALPLMGGPRPQNRSGHFARKNVSACEFLIGLSNSSKDNLGMGSVLCAVQIYNLNSRCKVANLAPSRYMMNGRVIWSSSPAIVMDTRYRGDTWYSARID